MKRVTSQDHLAQKGSAQQTARGRLSGYVAAAGRGTTSIASAHLITQATCRRISQHVGSDSLLRLSTGMVPGVVRWCAQKTVGRTISQVTAPPRPRAGTGFAAVVLC